MTLDEAIDIIDNDGSACSCEECCIARGMVLQAARERDELECTADLLRLLCVNMLAIYRGELDPASQPAVSTIQSIEAEKAAFEKAAAEPAA